MKIALAQRINTLGTANTVNVPNIMLKKGSCLTAKAYEIAFRILEKEIALQRDKHIPASPNAGYTISAMAGALNIQLEKQGYYTLGDDHGILPDHIPKALRVMTVTVALFGLVVVVPVLALRIFLVGL